jgi:hypothetical protein
LQDGRKGENKERKQLRNRAARAFAASRRRACFRENSAQLARFVEKPIALNTVSHVSLSCDLEPQFRFVSFFEDHTELRGKFCMGSPAAGRAVIASHAHPRPRELPRKSVSGDHARQRLDEVQDSNGETLRADLQIFGDLIHGRPELHAARHQNFLDFRSFLLSESNFLQSGFAAIQQFPPPRISPSAARAAPRAVGRSARRPRRTPSCSPARKSSAPSSRC